MKNEKKLLDFEIVPFEFAARSSRYFDASTCHRAVHVMTNGARVPDVTNGNFFELNISQIDLTIRER